MKSKVGTLHIEVGDNGYHLSTNSGEASYTLNGIPTLKIGIIDNLPDRLVITDRRSLPCAINVSAKPALWGAKVQWDWPKEADGAWRARVRAEYENGEEETLQSRFVNYPDSTYQVTDVPAGKKISLSVILEDGSGKRSKPAELNTKSSDDAAQILGGLGIISNGQVFIRDALIPGVSTHNVRMQVGVNASKASTADKLRNIVSKYLTGEGAQYVDDLVDELKPLIEKDADNTHLATIISEQIRQKLNKELQPGGLLHKR